MPRRHPLRFDAVKHERRHPWMALTLRVLICAGWTALAYGVSRHLGLALVLSAPAWAYLLAADLMAFASWLWRALRAVAHAEDAGQYLAYKGVRIRHEHDEVEAMVWLCVEDLSRALGEVIKPSTLRLQHPSGVRSIKGLDYVSDEVAVTYLGGRQTFGAPGLRKWIDREVSYPVRHRMGR